VQGLVGDPDDPIPSWAVSAALSAPSGSTSSEFGSSGLGPVGADHPDPVVALRAAVDGLAAVDPADLGDAAMADLVLHTRREIDRMEGCFARLVRAAHVRGVGTETGASSTAAWLARRVPMRRGDARAAIEAGEACELLSATGEAWRAGAISTGAARTIIGARVDGHDEALVACEPALVELARGGDLNRLRCAAARFRKYAESDGTAPRVPDGLHLSTSWAGRTVLNGDFGDLAGETLATAIHAYTEAPTDTDRRPASQRRADALVRICEIALERVPAGRRNRGQVSVVVDWTTLTAGRPGRADGQFSGPMHLDDVHRLLCDTTVSRVVTGPSGIPVDVGRAKRNPPPRLRRALVARDQGCRFPGCGRPPGWCDAHHIRHWTRGGPTDLRNLLLVCSYHHRLLHSPGWTVRFDGEELHIRGPDGTEAT